METTTLTPPLGEVIDTTGHETVATSFENVEVINALKTDRVDELFAQQVTAGDVARVDIIDAMGAMDQDSAMEALKLATKEAEDRALESFLTANGIDDSHVHHTKVKNLLTKYSYGRNIGKQLEWFFGDTSSSDPVAHTSGRERFAQEVKDLFGEVTEEESVPDDAELATFEAELETKRSNLAALSVARRSRLTRKTGKRSRKLAEQYEVAAAEYGDAYGKLGQKYVELMRTDPDLTDEEIAQAVIVGTVAERRNFTVAEQASLEEDKSFRNRLARIYSKRLGMTATNIALGGSIGFAARRITKFGLVAAVPVAGIAALAAVRAGKSIFTSAVGSRAQIHKDFTRRQNTDINQLTELFNTPDGLIPVGGTVSASEYARDSANLLQSSINERVAKDVRKNKQRTALSAAVAGGMVVAGALLASHFENLPGSGSGHEHIDTPDGSKLTDAQIDEKLRDAGVTSAADRANIINNPDAFNRMVSDPEAFGRFMDAANSHDTPRINLDVNWGDTLAHGHGELFTIPQGGGIIHDVIRPMASADGHSLTSAQETQIWQTVRARFGDNLFTDLSVGSHGSDQWIMTPGNGTLRPEVAQYLRDQIASTTVR